MAINSRKILSGLGWAIIAITIWSGSLVFLRLGVMTSLNAYDLTMLRFGVAALILSPVIFHRTIKTARIRPVSLISMVATFGAPYVLLIAMAMKTAPATAAGALNPGVMAIASLLLGWIIFNDRIGPVRVVGLIITTIGIILFTRADGTVTIGHLILGGTGIMWAIYALIIRRTAIPALHATAIIAVGSALVYLPVYLMILPKQIVSAPIMDVLIQVGFQGILVSIVALYAFNRSTELLGPTDGASLPALIPVATLSLGVLILNETAGADRVASAILVTVGLALILVGPPAMRWLSKFDLYGLNRKKRDTTNPIEQSSGDMK
ncbi:MAG TPA: EamA/RhaT family transporter [Rhizobiales bacterium]|nr:EamA/RhaT family transporter [Hyphomicrobiales bacterium]